MAVEFGEHLIEAVVRRHVDLNVQGIAAHYRAQSDRLVEAGLGKDPRRIRSLNYHFFKRLGLDRPFHEIPEEMPGAPAAVRIGAPGRMEGCFLSDDRERVLVRIAPERFETPERLKRFLRYEWQHILDILDPDFGYSDVGKPAPVVSDRLALLWGAYTDARTLRRGKDPLKTREDWARLFDRHWFHVDPIDRRTAFARFWESGKLHHGELMEVAREPGLFIERFAGTHAAATGPGHRCPLCRFPTFSWATPHPRLVRRIREDFGDWLEPQGVCDRCVELYESKLI